MLVFSLAENIKNGTGFLALKTQRKNTSPILKTLKKSEKKMGLKKLTQKPECISKVEYSKEGHEQKFVSFMVYSH